MSTDPGIDRKRHGLPRALLLSGLGLIIALALLVSTPSMNGLRRPSSARIALAQAADPTETDTPTPEASSTTETTATPAESMTTTPTDTPSPTLGPTNTSTWTPTLTPTNTPTRTPSLTPTNTPTRTPTVTPTNTPTPSCGLLAYDEAENLFMASTANDKLQAYLINSSPNYTIGLTSATVGWSGSAAPISVWHDELVPNPSVVFDKYQWSSTTIVNPPDRTLTFGSTFSDSLNAFVVNPNSNGYFMLDFTASLQGTAGQMYRHGRDWTIGLDYMVGNVLCHIDLQGRYGPIIQPTVPAVVSGPTFVVSADASDPDPSGTITQVYFEVFDSTGGAPHFTNLESGAPWCLNSDSGGTCNAISSYAWPNGVPINDGETYTITIRARDNDPHRQYTRVVRTLTIDRPTPSPTETPTETPTPTLTATPIPLLSCSDPGLIACYPFSGNANDGSGRGHDGVVYGATLTQDQLGRQDSAYYFDGANAYIVVPSAPDLNSLNTGMSVVAWIKIDPGTNYNVYDYRHILSKGATFGDLWADVAVGLSNPAGALSWEYADNDNIHVVAGTGQPIPQGDWHMVATTFAEGLVGFYVDGVLQSIYEGPYPVLRNSEQPLYIGARYQNPLVGVFQGVLDDVRLYDRPLTAAEIQVLYQQEAIATATPTPSHTPTLTRTPTRTPTMTVTRTRTMTPTSTRTPTVTPTRTYTRTPTVTMTRTNTPTDTPTPTATQTATPPSTTPSITPTATPTATVEPTPQHQVYLPLLEKDIALHPVESSTAIGIVRNVIEMLGNWLTNP